MGETYRLDMIYSYTPYHYKGYHVQKANCPKAYPL